MKKIITLSIALLALLSFNVQAQEEDKPNSNFGISIEGGFSHLYLGNNLSPFGGFTKPSFGGGGGAAFFYELQYRHFLFRTGFGMDYTVNMSKFESPDYTAGIAEYPSMLYHYDFKNFRETTTYGIGYVPVMFGGLFNRFFFLAGAKVGFLPFGGTTKPRTDATIWATDEDVIDPMEDIYTHQMTDYTFLGQKKNMGFKPLNIMGSIELGLNLDHKAWVKDEREKKRLSKAERYRALRQRKEFKDCLHYRISLFADFGFTNLFQYEPNPVPNPTASGPTADGGLYAFNDVSDITPYSLYGYAPHANAFLNNSIVGVKFAILYEVPHKAPKKGNMANPYIVTFVNDELTGKPLGGATVRTQTIPKGKAKKRTTEKQTDPKYGKVAKAYPAGDYLISVTRTGYFPQEPFEFTHVDDYDTLYVALYPQQKLRAQAVDAKTGRPVTATMTVFNEQGDKVVSADVDSVTKVLSTLVDGRKHFSVCATAKGYKDTCAQVVNVQDLQILRLEPYRIRRFILKNMFFATDKTKILPSSEPALQELYKLLSDNPDIRIRIIGHTDDVASDEYNQRLSEGRSRSVKKEMVDRGINPKRIETTGRGEKDPIVPNDSDEHRQMNRRVEIEILGGASIDSFIQNDQFR